MPGQISFQLRLFHRDAVSWETTKLWKTLTRNGGGRRSTISAAHVEYNDYQFAVSCVSVGILLITLTLIALLEN